MSDEPVNFPERKESSGRSLRFIDEFLQQKSSRRLTGLLLARLDAFNRIGATFGEDRSI
jgi:hypothetical protein